MYFIHTQVYTIYIVIYTYIQYSCIHIYAHIYITIHIVIYSVKYPCVKLYELDMRRLNVVGLAVAGNKGPRGRPATPPLTGVGRRMERKRQNSWVSIRAV